MMVGYGYLAGGGGAFQRTRNSLIRSAFGSIPGSSFAPWSIHRRTTSAWVLGTADRLSFLGGMRRSFWDTMSVYSSLSACLPGVTLSPSAPPAMNFSNVVMSNFPDRFLASWQA